MSFGNTKHLVAGATDITVVEISREARRTLSASADGIYELSIQHNESNENPGFPTQRSNVRVTMSKDVAESDKVVKGYVQLTTSIPKGQMTSDETKALVAMLVNFLCLGENTGASDVVALTDLAAVPRIYAGEP
jgi:hypothetical protein